MSGRVFHSVRLPNGEIEIREGHAPRWRMRNPDGFVSLSTRVRPITAAKFGRICQEGGTTIYAALHNYVNSCIQAGRVI